MVLSLVADLVGGIELMARTIACHIEACRALPEECSRASSSASAVAEIVKGLPGDSTSKATLTRLHGLLNEVSSTIQSMAQNAASTSSEDKNKSLLKRTMRRLSITNLGKALEAPALMKKLTEQVQQIDAELLRLTQGEQQVERFGYIDGQR